MNLYLSSMPIAVDPVSESLDRVVLASFCAAASSLSFLLATYQLIASNIQALLKHEEHFFFLAIAFFIYMCLFLA